MTVAISQIDEVNRDSLRTLKPLVDKLDLENASSFGKTSRDESLSQLYDRFEAGLIRVDRGIASFEQRVESGINAFEDRCSDGTEDTANRIHSIKQDIAAKADDWGESLVSAAETQLDILVTEVDEFQRSHCELETGIDRLYSSYQEKITQTRRYFDLNLTNHFWLDPLKELDKKIAPHISNYETLHASTSQKLKATEIKAITDRDLNRFIQEAFNSGLKRYINNWYWETLCINGVGGSNPTAEKPCGVDSEPQTPELIQSSIETLGRNLRLRLSEQSLTNLLLANGQRSVFDRFIKTIEVDYAKQSQIGLNDPIFEIGSFVRKDNNLPFTTRKDEVLYDSSMYVREDNNLPFTSRQDKVLYDSANYIRIDNNLPFSSRKDEILYDTTYYLRIDNNLPFNSRQDEIYYDCIGIKRSIASCQSILEGIKDKFEMIANKLVNNKENVSKALESNPWAPSIKKSGDQAKSDFQKDLPLYPRVHPNYGKSFEQMIDSLSQRIETSWINADGSVNRDHLAFKILSSHVSAIIP